jgi:hypothetical protein
LRLLLCLTSLLIAASGGVLARAQPRDADYWTLVSEYRRSIRGVRERLAAMPQEQIRSAVDGARDKAAADWPELRAAAVMHSEAWYYAVTSRDPSASFHVTQGIGCSRRSSGSNRASAGSRTVGSTSCWAWPPS